MMLAKRWGCGGQNMRGSHYSSDPPFHVHGDVLGIALLHTLVLTLR